METLVQRRRRARHTARTTAPSKHVLMLYIHTLYYISTPKYHAVVRNPRDKRGADTTNAWRQTWARARTPMVYRVQQRFRSSNTHQASFESTPTLFMYKSELTGAGELRVHVFVDGRHPAEYQRPALLEHGQDSAWNKRWRF